MTQTAAAARRPLPLAAPDLRLPRNDRCGGEGGWTVGGEDPWWTACEGCCTCMPNAYRAVAQNPAANSALAKAMAATADLDAPF